MSWEVEYLPEAARDVRKLDGSIRKMYLKALAKVRTNPLPETEGGYGKPLGNKDGRNLTGYLKIKLRSAGLRVVYRLERRDGKMIIVVVGMRADEEVYDTAAARAARHDESC